MICRAHFLSLLTFLLLIPANGDTLRIPTGQYLDKLPGHASSQGREYESLAFQLSLEDVDIQGPAGTDGNPLVQFTSKAYRNLLNGQMFTSGPTIRVERGGNFTIRLTNNLVGPGEVLEVATSNTLRLPSFTNVHTHGLWGDPGVRAQPPVGMYPPYIGGDNIFFPLAPRPNSSVPYGDALQYKYHIDPSHMPGVFWYHPHFHGSSALHSTTAKGVFIVEGEEEFLVEEGCDPLAQLLLGGGVQEWVMQVEGWMFGGNATSPPAPSTSPPPPPPPSPSPAPGTSPMPEKPPSADSYPTISSKSNPVNPTCCNTTQGFQSAGQNFLTINGGYQPVVKMTAGVWQRWRLINTAYMRYVDLTWVTEDGEAAPCELMLLAKDGVFLQQMPREVDHVMIPAAGRADLLVRCEAPTKSGTRLVVRSGAGPLSTPPPMCNSPACRVMPQDTLLSMEVEPLPPGATRDPTLDPEACTPLRPSYLADLRDDALGQAGVDLAELVKGQVEFTAVTEGDYSGACAINGVPFSIPDSDPLVAPLGSVVEWELKRADLHPHHLHIVPMQIIKLPVQLENSTYFKVGDHHDTLLLPVGDLSGAEATVRFQPGRFTGYAVHHCHNLVHEDHGCMKIVKWQCPGYPGNYQPEQCEFEYPVPGTLPPEYGW